MNLQPFAKHLGPRILLALIVAAAALDLRPAAARESTGAAARTAVLAAAEAPAARGMLLRPAAIGPSPWAAGVARSAAGTPVTVSGTLSLRVGLRRVAFYRVDVSGPPALHGWVAADAVLVQAGQVPGLDLRSLTAETVGPQGAGAPSAASAAAVTSGSSAAVRAAVGDFDDLPIWLPNSVRRWAPEVHEAAARHRIDPALLAIVILVESGGWSRAHSPAGAYGLTQLMPATAAEMMAATRPPGNRDDWRDPAVNIDLGAAYLARQSQSFAVDAQGDAREQVRLIAAAYNGGPGRLRRSLDSWAATLPTETLRYQRWIVGMWDERRLAESNSFKDWAAAGGERLLLAGSTEP